MESQLRRTLATAAMFASLILLGGLLTQCRMVTDAVTTASVSGGDDQKGAGNCMSACAHAYADSTHAEVRIHVANVHACSGDAACEAAEDARHEAAMARISAGRQECHNRCHNQGGGKGGR